MDCPRLVSNLYTPNIMWYQTDITVIIRILLSDVSSYYLRVENDHLLFSTVINDKSYCLCLYLFGPVVAENTSHKNVGREIKIYLTKELKWFEWLRLILAKEKTSLIISDPDHIYEKDYPNRKVVRTESIEEYKRRNNIRYIMPVVPSSDEDESEDDELDFLKFS